MSRASASSSRATAWIRGERILVGQRIDGVVAVADVPAGDHGRVYLVERHVESNAALDGLVAAYLADCQRRGQPAALCPTPRGPRRRSARGKPAHSLTAKETDMKADDNHETCLLVSHETNRYGNDKPTLRFTVRPVRVTANATIRHFTDTFGGEPLADLAITAQLDHVAADPHPYRWRTEYRQPYAVDLRRAQTMVRVLRKIDRGLERMRGQFGPPRASPPTSPGSRARSASHGSAGPPRPAAGPRTTTSTASQTPTR